MKRRPRHRQPRQGRRRSSTIARRRLGVELMPRPPTVPEVDENADTLEGNARLKAVALATAAPACRRSPTTPASRSTPSAARPACTRPATRATTRPTPTTSTLLLERSTGVPPEQRTARFSTVALVCWPDGREVVADGDRARATSRVEPRGDAASATTRCSSPTRATAARSPRCPTRREARAVAPRAGVPGARRRARLTYALITSRAGRSPTCRSPRRHSRVHALVQRHRRVDVGGEHLDAVADVTAAHPVRLRSEGDVLVRAEPDLGAVDRRGCRGPCRVPSSRRRRPPTSAQTEMTVSDTTAPGGTGGRACRSRCPSARRSRPGSR